MTSRLSARLVAGAAGGLVGGVLLGVAMQMMGMIESVAGLIGAEGVVLGWIVHVVIAVVIGLGYALLFGGMTSGYGRGVLSGLIYGGIWWVVGPLILMPLMLGGDILPAIGEDQLKILAGHLLYGLALGLVYVAIWTQISTPVDDSAYDPDVLGNE